MNWRSFGKERERVPFRHSHPPSVVPAAPSVILAPPIRHSRESGNPVNLISPMETPQTAC